MALPSKPRLLLFILPCFLSFYSSAQRFSRTDSFRVGAYGAAAWGDYDGDGRPDLAYGAQTMQAGQSDFLTIYHNTPTGMVALPLNLPYMPLPHLCWADLDNNGSDELIASGINSNGDPQTIIYQHNGSNVLAPLPNVHLPGFDNGVTAAADYNGDGWKDLFMTGYDDSFQVRAVILKGGPNFSFTPISAPIVGIQAGEAKWGDYNNDGRPDLLVNGDAIGVNGYRTRIYKNMGADSFQMLPTFFPGTRGTVDWLDYDSDGLLDFLVTGVDSTSAHNRTDLYHNNGNDSFSVVITNIPEFGEPSAVAIGDFNQDGKPDICLGGGNGTSAQYSMLAYGTGTGQFVLDSLYPADIQNCIAETADFDGDGYPDLLLSSNLLRNRGIAAAVTNVSFSGKEMSVYPNPVGAQASTQLEWQSAKAGPETLTMHNAQGILVRQEPVFQQKGENRLAVSFKDLAAGVYFIRLGAAQPVQVIKQ